MIVFPCLYCFLCGKGSNRSQSHDQSHAPLFLREIQSHGKKQKNVKIQPQGFVDNSNCIIIPPMHSRPLCCLPHHYPIPKHGMSRRGGTRTPPARAATSRHCGLMQYPSCADWKRQIIPWLRRIDNGTTPSPPPPCLQCRQPTHASFNAKSLLQGRHYHSVLV